MSSRSRSMSAWSCSNRSLDAGQPPFNPSNAPRNVDRRESHGNAETKSRSQFGRLGGSSAANAPWPRRSADAGQGSATHCPCETVPVSVRFWPGDPGCPVAQTARSLRLRNSGNTPEPSNHLRHRAFAQDPSLPTVASLTTPPLPALPARPATHALIAMPALTSMPATAIPGLNSPSDPTQPNTHPRHQPLPTSPVIPASSAGTQRHDQSQRNLSPSPRAHPERTFPLFALRSLLLHRTPAPPLLSFRAQRSGAEESRLPSAPHPQPGRPAKNWTHRPPKWTHPPRN